MIKINDPKLLLLLAVANLFEERQNYEHSQQRP